MQKVLTTGPTEEQAVTIHPLDFGAALQEELATLAAIDARYECLTERLSGWSAPAALKKCRARRLQQRHRKEREPHVLRLAELHQQVMTITTFCGPATLH